MLLEVGAVNAADEVMQLFYDAAWDGHAPVLEHLLRLDLEQHAWATACAGRGHSDPGRWKDLEWTPQSREPGRAGSSGLA